MIQKTYAARMKRIHAMLRGIAAHWEQLEKHGATSEFRETLTIFTENLQQIQEQRQTIKKLSIEATTAKNLNLNKAERLCSKARKWVRREFPPEAWIEFGFEKGQYGKEANRQKNQGVTDEDKK